MLGIKFFTASMIHCQKNRALNPWYYFCLNKLLVDYLITLY